MMRSIRVLVLLFGLLAGGGAWATHNQAGEILVCSCLADCSMS